MFATRSPRRSLFMLALIASPALVVACDDDDPVEPDPEPTFNRVEFALSSTTTTDTDTVTVNTSGVQTGVADFPAGTTTVTITRTRFLNADGSVDAIVTPADFELRGGTGGSTGVTFALTAGQSFQGTIAGLTNGARTIRMLLWHKGDNHEDFSQLLSLQIGP
jgi:hypothetical protein